MLWGCFMFNRKRGNQLESWKEKLLAVAKHSGCGQSITFHKDRSPKHTANKIIKQCDQIRLMWRNLREYVTRPKPWWAQKFSILLKLDWVGLQKRISFRMSIFGRETHPKTHTAVIPGKVVLQSINCFCKTRLKLCYFSFMIHFVLVH